MLLASTAVAGVAGYAIQLFVPAFMDADDYVLFSVSWSTIYLIGAAVGGVQQEITRATRPMIDGRGGGRVLTRYTFCIAVCVVVVVTALVLLAGETLFGEFAFAIAIAIVVGGLGYLVLAVIAGVFYGLRLWPQAALVTVFDALLRATLVLAGVAAQLPTWIIAIFVAAPFCLTFFIVFGLNRKKLRGAFQLDAPLAMLLRNTAQTVGAAIAMGIMITGLPLLLTLWAGAEPQAVVGTLILAITLTRAPIVIPLVALQSYIVSRARGMVRLSARGILTGGFTIAVSGTVIGAAAWALGPIVIEWLSAGRLSISAPMMMIIALSAILVATLSVTGSLLLAQSRHRIYAAGWIVAAVLTVALLALPFDFESRVAWAILAAPVTGLLCHLVALLRPVEAAPPEASAIIAGETR